MTKRDNQLRVDRLRRVILRANLNLGEERDNREAGAQERRVRNGSVLCDYPALDR